MGILFLVPTCFEKTTKSGEGELVEKKKFWNQKKKNK
jgi:hypothetical protein